ncbi:MAG: alpha/beta hydrolase [Chloroflexi bacterium]|nr:alpha/beta hydrolase [Chloroflexota bacterium]
MRNLGASPVPGEGFVNVSGLRLHYLVWNPDGGQDTIVMLHGLRGEASIWATVAEPLADQGLRVLALDQRGRGFSDWATDGDYSRAAYVRDLEGLSAALKLDRFALIGASMGGANAVAFAAVRPDLVTGLVLEDPAIFLPRADGQVAGQSRIPNEVNSTPTSFNTWDEAAEYARGRRPTLSGAGLEAYLRATLKPLDDGRVTWRYDLEGIRRAMQARRGEHAEQGLWSQVAQVRCPTLILRAAQSDVVSPEAVAALLASIPTARAVEIPRAGHSIHLDNLSDYMAAVAPFISSLKRPLGASASA